MKQSDFKIIKNIPLTRDVYEMTLEGDTSAITAAGQFVNIKIDGLYLRRPISVCDAESDRLIIIYKVVGKGTQIMSELGEGVSLDILTGLGNGYDLDKSGDKPLLIGGGVGGSPLYPLSKKMKALTIKIFNFFHHSIHVTHSNTLCPSKPSSSQACHSTRKLHSTAPVQTAYNGLLPPAHL